RRANVSSSYETLSSVMTGAFLEQPGTGSQVHRRPRPRRVRSPVLDWSLHSRRSLRYVRPVWCSAQPTVSTLRRVSKVAEVYSRGQDQQIPGGILGEDN